MAIPGKTQKNVHETWGYPAYSSLGFHLETKRNWWCLTLGCWDTPTAMGGPLLSLGFCFICPQELPYTRFSSENKKKSLREVERNCYNDFCISWHSLTYCNNLCISWHSLTYCNNLCVSCIPLPIVTTFAPCVFLLTDKCSLVCWTVVLRIHSQYFCMDPESKGHFYPTHIVMKPRKC